MTTESGIPNPEQLLAMSGFDFAVPEILTPGGLAIVSHSMVSQKFRAFLREPPQKRLWYVRAELGFEPSFPPCFGAGPPRLLSKTEGQMFVSVTGSRISSQALSFQPIGNAAGEIIAFGLQVESESPTQALEDAREPFGELLDALTAPTGAPLRYTQYAIAESNQSRPLAFEVHVPFQTQLRFEKGQFLPLHSLFSIPDALIREGVCSESPYYRLLCAYRVRDAIDRIRGILGKAAATINKQKMLPKLPVIPATEILQRGANLGRTDAEKDKVEPDRVFNLLQLFDFWSEKRNAVAHLFQKESGGSKEEVALRALVPSIGRDYRDFASSAAILLWYARSYLNQLKVFLREHLEPPPFETIVTKTYFGRDIKYIGALLMEAENPQRRL